MKHIISIIILFICNISIGQLKWEQTCGPEGTASQNLFCGDEYAYVSDDVYLYRSNDGLVWEKFPYGGIENIAILKSTLVANFTSHSNLSGNEIYLRISYDNGEHWKDIPKPPFDVDYSSMILLSHGLYIVDNTRTKLLFTADEGISWEEKIIPLAGIAKMYSDQNRIYINDDANLWQSDETGNNWIKIEFPASISIFQVISKDSSLLVFVIDGIYSSKDAGKNWKFVAIDWYSFFQTLPFFELNGLYLYMSYELNGFARSTDFFAKERIDLNATKKLPYISKMKIFKNKLIVQTEGLGIHFWDENTFTLIAANKGFGTPAIWHTTNTSNFLWASTPNSVYGYDLIHNSWTLDSKLPTPSRDFNFISANQYGWLASFSDTSFGHFYFSEDDGKNWNYINAGSSNKNKQVKWITLLDTVIFVHFADSVWRSEDHGINWQALPYRLLNQIVKFKNQYITSDTSKIYTSNDLGVHWYVLLDFKKGLIEGLEAGNDFLIANLDPDGRDSIFNYNLYKSTNGVDWNKADKGLPSNSVKLKFINRRQSDRTLFEYNNVHFLNLGVYGLYQSKDSMLNWTKLEGSLTYNFTNYHIIDSTVFGGTSNQGLFRASLNTLLTKIDDAVTKSDSKKIAIYPNPIQDKLQIEINENGPITIIVYTQYGQKLNQCYSNSKIIELNLGNFSPGTYFIQLIGEHIQQTIKILKL